MQKYIDQAIFDSGVLVLGIFGSLELDKKKSKFDIEEFINSQKLIETYQSIRPDDILYRPQTIESLLWLLSSTPIGLAAHEISGIYRAAYNIRSELNADMQPPSMKERIFRGAIFQKESKNYIDRINQCKINICTIINQISAAQKINFDSLQKFENKINSRYLYSFILNASNYIEGIIHKQYIEEKIYWETKFHLALLVASCCYFSAIRRFENHPNYNEPIKKIKILEEVQGAIIKFSSNNISNELALQALDLYLNDYISSNSNLYDKSEKQIWDNISIDFNTSKWTMENDDLNDFLSIAESQINNYDTIDTFNVDMEKIGFEFYNSNY